MRGSTKSKLMHALSRLDRDGRSALLERLLQDLGEGDAQGLLATLRGRQDEEDDATPVYQASIHPDTAATRDVVTRAVGWRFVEKQEKTIWNVAIPGEVEPGYCVTIEITDGVTEVTCSLEWP